MDASGPDADGGRLSDLAQAHALADRLSPGGTLRGAASGAAGCTWHDVVARPDGRLAVLVGARPAGATGGEVRALVRSLVRSGSASPGRLLADIAAALPEPGPVQLVLALLSETGGASVDVTWAAAGLPGPLLLDGLTEARALDLPQPGQRPGAPGWQDGSLTLAPGSTLLLCTSAARALLRSGALLQGLPPQRLCRALVDRLSDLEDEVSVLATQVPHPHPAALAAARARARARAAQERAESADRRSADAARTASTSTGPRAEVLRRAGSSLAASAGRQHSTSRTTSALAAARTAADLGLRMLFQPVVDLADRTVVGYEALARGAAGSALEPAAGLLAAARERGVLADLDTACRDAALAAALQAHLGPDVMLLVNADPEAMDGLAHSWVSDPSLVSASGPRRVLEVTERALTDRPARVLATVEAAREAGWAIALDDVGADPGSLALMPFLAPDVLKLDLRLVQGATTAEVAAVVGVVQAHAEATGALVLAEGVETEDQATLALSMGATLAQGWLYGRPAALPRRPDLPRPAASVPQLRPSARTGTPYDLVADSPRVRVAQKSLLMAQVRHLERTAAALGPEGVVLGTFQDEKYFTPTTAERWWTLSSSLAYVGALGVGLGPHPVPGVHGADLDEDDPVTKEWDVVVVGGHYAAALMAREVSAETSDQARRYEYVLTHDRAVVVEAGRRLLRRMVDHDVDLLEDLDGQPSERQRPLGDGGLSDGPGPLHLLVPATPLPPASPRFVPAEPHELADVMGQAAKHAPFGLVIADATQEDQPLVWVNDAFCDMSGYAPEQVLGRNCRFLQGDGTDRGAVAQLRSRLQAERRGGALLLNYRRDGTAFWNDLTLVPVHDQAGRLTHVVGLARDVTETVDRTLRMTDLVHRDVLTGLANRRALQDMLAREAPVAAPGRLLAALFLDLDGFKAVNDLHGHATGDRLLAAVAARLLHHVRDRDLLARPGGDEFVLVLPGLDRVETAVDRGRQLLDALLRPFSLDGQSLQVRASIGVAYADGPVDPGELLARADHAMYLAKREGGSRAQLQVVAGVVVPAQE